MDVNKSTKDYLTWRNCKHDPPNDDIPELSITDGEKVYTVAYYKSIGFFDIYVGRALPKYWLGDLWWGDDKNN